MGRARGHGVAAAGMRAVAHGAPLIVELPAVPEREASMQALTRTAFGLHHERVAQDARLLAAELRYLQAQAQALLARLDGAPVSDFPARSVALRLPALDDADSSLQGLAQLADGLHEPSVAQHAGELRGRLALIQAHAQALVDRLDARRA